MRNRVGNQLARIVHRVAPADRDELPLRRAPAQFPRRGTEAQCPLVTPVALHKVPRLDRNVFEPRGTRVAVVGRDRGKVVQSRVRHDPTSGFASHAGAFRFSFSTVPVTLPPSAARNSNRSLTSKNIRTSSTRSEHAARYHASSRSRSIHSLFGIRLTVSFASFRSGSRIRRPTNPATLTMTFRVGFSQLQLAPNDVGPARDCPSYCCASEPRSNGAWTGLILRRPRKPGLGFAARNRTVLVFAHRPVVHSTMRVPMGGPAMPGYPLNTTVVIGHRVAPGSWMNRRECLSPMGIRNGPAPVRVSVRCGYMTGGAD